MFTALIDRYEVLSGSAASALPCSAKAALPGTQPLAESWFACMGNPECLEGSIAAAEQPEEEGWKRHA